MEEKDKAIETPSIATEEAVPTLTPEEDAEARFQALEAEKNKAIEEAANYKLAYLKEKKKHKEEEPDSEETDEERIERITRKALAESRLAEIAREQDAIIQKALKENKELKLAQIGKTTVPASVGAHSESIAVVKDTLVTPEQLEAFKARGWTDKDIERYKKNLQRNSR